MIIDILVIAGLFAICLVFSLKFGKKCIVGALISLIISIPLYKYFILDTGFFSFSIVTSLIVYVVILLVIWWIIKSHLKGGTFPGRDGLMKAAFLCACFTLLFVIVYFAFLPETIYTFDGDTKRFLTIRSEGASLGIYTLASLIGLFITQPKNS